MKVSVKYTCSNCPFPLIISGSPYINASRPEYQLPNFPIGMVFIFVIIGGIAFSAVICSFIKIYEIHRDRKRDSENNNDVKKMSTMTLRAPSPSRELLNHTSIDYLSMAAIPLLSLYAFSKKMKSKGFDFRKDDSPEFISMSHDISRQETRDNTSSTMDQSGGATGGACWNGNVSVEGYMTYRDIQDMEAYPEHSKYQHLDIEIDKDD